MYYFVNQSQRLHVNLMRWLVLSLLLNMGMSSSWGVVSPISVTGEQRDQNPLLAHFYDQVKHITRDFELLPVVLEPSVREYQRVLANGPAHAIVSRVDEKGKLNYDVRGQGLGTAFMNLLRIGTVEDPSRRYAAAQPVRPRLPEPITIGLFPLGPQDTGKSVLVNMAAMLSGYFGHDDLKLLDDWFTQHYGRALTCTNPFAAHYLATPFPTLDRNLDRRLTRFVPKGRLLTHLQQDREYRPNVMLPAVQEARYSYVDQHGRGGIYPADELYDFTRSDRAWQLIIGNRRGWYHGPQDEGGMASQVDLLEQVKARLESGLVENMRWVSYLNQYLLLQISGTDLVLVHSEQQSLDENEPLNGLVTAAKYVQEHVTLPLFLAVSYAGELPEDLETEVHLAQFFAQYGVHFDTQHIFFFEMSGILDIGPGAHYLHGTLDRYLELEEDVSNCLFQYGCATDLYARQQLLEGAEVQLERIASALRVHWAKNLAVLHRLFKRIHTVTQLFPAQAAGETLLGQHLPRDTRLVEARRAASFVRLNTTTRQCMGDTHRVCADPLSTSHVHFIRLFTGSRRLTVEEREDRMKYAYDFTLTHRAEGLDEDFIFDLKRDVPEDVRNKSDDAYYALWTPKKPPSVTRRAGMVIKTHGTLKTVVNPGFTVVFSFNRVTNENELESRIRDFQADEVLAHNQLQVQWEALEAARLTQEMPGQQGWLVMNTDGYTREVDQQNVHEDQRAALLEARERNLRRMVRHVTGRDCTEEQLNAQAFVIPGRNQQLTIQRQGEMTTYWVYTEDVSRAQFEDYLNRENPF